MKHKLYRVIIGGMILISGGMTLTACHHATTADHQQENPFTDEVRLKTTPVKDQGRSETCWAYAMLATIETERLMLGDSVNLSPHYPVRMLMREKLTDYYLSRGRHRLQLRGMAPLLLRLSMQYGIVPYSSYGPMEEVSYQALCTKAMLTARTCRSFRQLDERFNMLMDETVGILPRNAFMAGVRYTPLEFAHSVCLPDDYEAVTSYTHHPFYEHFVLETPDNSEGSAFLNLPIDSLMRRIDDALHGGHPVCWEGDISNSAFSFEKGTAVLWLDKGADIQALRQQSFEGLRTTDDHAMALIGIATDKEGRRYYIAKNSWGTGNPFGGLMYLSADYLRLHTLCVVMKKMRNEK